MNLAHKLNAQAAGISGGSPGSPIFDQDHFGQRAAAAMGVVAYQNALRGDPTFALAEAERLKQLTQLQQNGNDPLSRRHLFNPQVFLNELIGKYYQ